MTSRERLLAALRHDLPDRTPTAIIMRGEAKRAIMAHFGVAHFDDVLRTLGIEDYRDINFEISFPEFENRKNGSLEGDCPFAGKRYHFHDERTFEDGWGVVRRVGRDGDLRSLMPDLIEVGFDVIDSIQPECMESFELKREFGERITLHGCGSLQTTLPFGGPEDCRREVVELIEGCGYDGGLILKPSNMIGWDVPIENIIAWYEAARDYDLADLPARW